jgi:hypothetical protein
MQALLDMLDWPAMGITLLAAWSMASQRPKRRALAFWLFSIGNVLWIGWGWPQDAYALIVLNVGLLSLNIRGIIKNEHQQKSGADPQDQ